MGQTQEIISLSFSCDDVHPLPFSFYPNPHLTSLSPTPPPATQHECIPDHCFRPFTQPFIPIRVWISGRGRGCITRSQGMTMLAPPLRHAVPNSRHISHEFTGDTERRESISRYTCTREQECNDQETTGGKSVRRGNETRIAFGDTTRLQDDERPIVRIPCPRRRRRVSTHSLCRLLILSDTSIPHLMEITSRFSR